MGLIRLVEVAFDLAGMEERGVDFYTPMTSQTPEEGNPAKRSDPREPVSEEDRRKLPRNDKKKLAKSCFAYNMRKLLAPIVGLRTETAKKLATTGG